MKKKFLSGMFGLGKNYSNDDEQAKQFVRQTFAEGRHICQSIADAIQLFPIDDVSFPVNDDTSLEVSLAIIGTTLAILKGNSQIMSAERARRISQACKLSIENDYSLNIYEATEFNRTMDEYEETYLNNISLKKEPYGEMTGIMLMKCMGEEALGLCMPAEDPVILDPIIHTVVTDLMAITLAESGNFWKGKGAAFQEEDEAWQGEVREILLDGIEVAKLIVSLKIEAGEGAVLQRITHFVRGLFHRCDYQRLARRATELVGDAREYRGTVNAFCARVKDGWTDRTKQQAAYFCGLCQRLEEMANHAKIIIEHKAGINRMIALDVKRVRQGFSQSYRTFIELSYVVLDESQINSDANSGVHNNIGVKS